jgi:hypothetical protein
MSNGIYRRLKRGRSTRNPAARPGDLLYNRTARRAVSSAAEHRFYTPRVAGSNPAPPRYSRRGTLGLGFPSDGRPPKAGSPGLPSMEHASTNLFRFPRLLFFARLFRLTLSPDKPLALGSPPMVAPQGRFSRPPLHGACLHESLSLPTIIILCRILSPRYFREDQ